MATLRHVHTRRTISIRHRHLVGRSSRCELVLTDPSASGEHALLAWANGWTLRDLGSRNGTWLDGAPILTGQPIRVQVDGIISFGSGAEAWILIDDAPPPLRAHSDTGRHAETKGTVLLIPDADAPQLCVFQTSAGQWVAEGSATRITVGDGSVLPLGAELWTLQLPTQLPETRAPAPHTLANSGLRFEVSRDEEHVRLWLDPPEGQSIDLGSRAHHYALLVLARHRLEDQRDQPDSAAQSWGWRYQETVVRELGIAPNLLHIHLHRARRQLGNAGLPDAGALIERRPATAQLRLGCSRIHIKQV